MPTRKQINRGFYGFADDSAEFLKPSNTNPYEASASGVGYNASKDDDYGYDRGALGFTDDDPAFRRPSTTGPDIDAPHTKLSGLIDGQVDHPAGKLLGGGGPVSDNKTGGVGPGRPRFAPKNVGAAGQKNWDSRGGRNR